jgi:hypothetical protein
MLPTHTASILHGVLVHSGHHHYAFHIQRVPMQHHQIGSISNRSSSVWFQKVALILPNVVLQQTASIYLQQVGCILSIFAQEC